MQIELFPNENTPEDPEAEIQRGQAGPIRFAATATSYPHVARVFADLISGVEKPTPASPALD